MTLFLRRMTILAILLFVAAPAPAGTLDAAHLQSLLKEVAEITGLAVKRPVPARTLTRDDWKRWVEDEIRRTVKPEEIRADELALRMFGLIPRDYDLRKATVDLLGEQAAAVYDPRQKLMLVVDSASPEGAMADMVLVHELAHALADQHFDLKRFLEKGAKTGEDQTARLAVVEGQAMWVMLEWQMRKSGSSLKSNRAALDMMLPMMGRMAAEQFPIFSTAPLYMKETLLFPYSAGILFQQAAIERSPADAFIRVLRKPPGSTRQILHPETWVADEPAAQPSLPPLPSRKDYRTLAGGTLGELDLRILLEQFISQDDARAVSPHWRGGEYEISETRNGAHPLLRWSIQLSTPESASRLLDMWARMMEKKAEKTAFTTRTADRLEGANQDGAFLIVRDAAILRGLEGILLPPR